jgi:hypothetical protein
MTDAEVITTAVAAAMFFNGNHAQACDYMKDHKLISNMLEKSRFNRRLHDVDMLINDLSNRIHSSGVRIQARYFVRVADE